MKLIRLFDADAYKGTRNYIETQQKYEIARTILYFAISGCIFTAGFLAAKTRLNLLTIVAVLGCLPACKSAVGMIMFLRFKSMDGRRAEEIESRIEGPGSLFDMVFTAYERNYPVSHLFVRGNTICGFTEYAKFEEQAFYQHLDGILKLEKISGVSVKIFRDAEFDKYLSRLEQMKGIEEEHSVTEKIVSILKSVVL